MFRPLITLFVLFSSALFTVAQCPVLINPSDGGNGCITTTETPFFTNVSGASVSGQTITKTANGNGWNAGAATINKVYTNGKLETVIDQTNTERAFGLSASNNGNNPNTIEFAIRILANATLEIYESGTFRTNAGGYALGDVLSVRNENGVIRYYRNEDVLWESAIAPANELVVDISLRTPGSRLSELAIANQTSGLFEATAFFNLGFFHSYFWSLNGVDFGGNESTVALGDYEDGDILTCEVFSVSFACFGFNMSNSITLHKPASQSVEFFIEGLYDPVSNSTAEEGVVWNQSSLVNVQANGNQLVKIQGSVWDAGASSLNTVKQDGYLEFIPAETNRRRMVGLSASDANANFNTIGYAFYLLQNGSLRIYENGANRGLYGSYTSGSVLRIAEEGGFIRYYRDGVLLRSVAHSETLPLVVDVSIRDMGGTVTQAVVGNLNSGSFAAATVWEGESPVFQWKLNGVDVGSDAPSYVNGNLYNGDIIACVVSFPSENCESEGVVSNRIRFITERIATDWTGAVSSAWDNPSNWSNGVPDESTSARIGAGMPHDPQVNTNGAVKDIELSPGVELTFLGNSAMRLFGNLSNNGTFSAGAGVVAFSGEGTQRISGNPTRFNRLITNMTGVNDSIIFDSDVDVVDETVFINGVIYTTENELIYLPGSDSREGLANSHVEGVCRKIGNTPFRFPVGRNGIYAPISISAPAQLSDAFTATYYDSDPEADGFSQSLQDGSISTISQCEYWQLDRVVGSSVVSVTLSYENARSCGVVNPNELLVLRWDGNQWQNHGYLTHQGDAASGSVTSGLPIFDFSPFTLGSGSSINPLPIELIDFKATPLEREVALEWTTASEINNDFFVLERSDDGIEFGYIGEVQGAGNAVIQNTYTFHDDAPLNGLAYYRLTQVDFDGSSETFPMVAVRFGTEKLAQLYPNPSNGNFAVDFGSEAIRDIHVYDSSGRLILQTVSESSQVRVDLKGRSSGIYFVDVMDSFGVKRYKHLIIGD
jgi:hypothetical protein